MKHLIANLKELDFSSSTWRQIELAAKKRIEECRDALEAPITDHDTTISLRAEIKTLRALLALPTPEIEFAEGASYHTR